MAKKYIDSDRLRAEIEKQSQGEQGFRSEDAEYGYRSCARYLLDFLDSLQREKPMEFDANRLLEILSDRVKLFKGWSSETVSPIRIDECEQIIDIIKQLIPAQNKDWEEKRKQECSCRRLSDNGGYECERYAGAFGACDGRCSWVVDYPKLKEMEEKEQPEVDLEKIIEHTYHDGSVADTDDIDHVTYENIARHFYELGKKDMKEQMMKEAVEADVKLTLHDKTGDVSLHTGYLPKELGIKWDDMVRIIIVKEEENK